MFKSMLALTCAVAGLATVPHAGRGAALRLKEEEIFVEYTASANEAVIKVKGESEASLEQLEMRAPGGAIVLSVRAPEGRALSITGFAFDLLESDPLTVLQAYAEGTYEMRGRTVLGRTVAGEATLSHLLPAPPVITYPRSGDVHVAANGLTVTWLPDASATGGYQVMLEQNDNDGLSVRMPPGSTSLRVPDGVLRPGVRTLVEVGAIGEGGNCTLVEVPFRVE